MRASRCRIGSSRPTARIRSFAWASLSDSPCSAGPVFRFRTTLPSNMAGCCARKATRVRNCVGAIWRASRPPSSTAPASGSTSVASARANVLLPLPEGPWMATASPDRTRIDARSRIRRPSRTTTSSRASSVEVISRKPQSPVAWSCPNLTGPRRPPSGGSDRRRQRVDERRATAERRLCRIEEHRAQRTLHHAGALRN